MEEERNLYRVLAVKPEGKRPVGRQRCRWEDGIRLELREMGWSGFGWLRTGTSGELL
jgi:hypothetical protein